MTLSNEINCYRLTESREVQVAPTRLARSMQYRHLALLLILSINPGPRYEVLVRPEKTTLLLDVRDTEIKIGMGVTAAIKVGKRRISEFYIYPLIRYTRECTSVRQPVSGKIKSVSMPADVLQFLQLCYISPVFV